MRVREEKAMEDCDKEEIQNKVAWHVGEVKSVTIEEMRVTNKRPYFNATCRRSRIQVPFLRSLILVLKYIKIKFD